MKLGNVSRETKGMDANPIFKDNATDVQVKLCVNRPNNQPDAPVYNHGTVTCDGDVVQQ